MHCSTCSRNFKNRWTNLPSELLSKIADGFEMVDLLRFRAVCKDWRSASYSCSGQTESSGIPWLIASPTEEGSNNYILFNRMKDKKYVINIPELEGTNCLASDLGWLLLSRGNEIFFLCPFSRAKIELPAFPLADLADHVAAFNCCPTSQECVVTVLNRCNDDELEVHMIQRGNNTWNRYVYTRNRSEFNQLTGATYRILEIGEETDSGMMPFGIRKAYLWRVDLKLLDISENAGISTCGTMIRTFDHETFIEKENIKGTSDKSHKVIRIHPRFHQIPPGQGWSV